MRKLFRREEKSGSSLQGPTTSAPDDFPSGIKQFYDSPGQCDVDVVFIHGLDGNREKTWTAKGAQEPWPKALLPLELPSARILTFGYDAYAAKWEKGGSQNRIGDHAWNLLTALASCREDGDKRDQPIIFVCHSLGGLVCKDALVLSKLQSDAHLHNIYEKTHAIAFLGTPHRGSDLAKWAERLLKSANVVKRRNADIVGLLNEKSEVLERIHESFLRMIWNREGDASKHIEVACFHEELPMSIKGFSKIVVSKDSATLPGSIRIGIHRDHSQMTKFASQDDPGFKAVCGELRRWVTKAKASHPHSGLATLPLIENRGLTSTNMTLRQKEVQTQSAHHVKFIVPYLRNENFVERKEILDQLKARLSFEGTSCDSQRRVSLFGLGGAGKTQIALAFIYWLKEIQPEVSVIWVHASNPERFLQSFSNIAREFQMPSYDDPKSNVLLLVLEWLKKKEHGKWLMVVDNSDDAELFFGKSSYSESDSANLSTSLASYLPECVHGALLITTRNKQVGVKLAAGDGSSLIEVGAMNTTESSSLLQASLKTITAEDEELKTLSSRLEQLPLALTQAASFIWEYGIPVSEYLELLSEGDETLINLLSEEFETSARDRDTSRAVAETWTVSFQQIKKQHPLASELLSIMSFLDRQDIPIEFLREYNDQRKKGRRNNIELKKAIGVLKNFSLLTEQSNGNLEMHRLVQLVTQSWMAKTGGSDHFRKMALITVSELYPYWEFENRAVGKAYLAHALAVLELDVANDDKGTRSRGALLHNVASYFSQEGKYRQARNMYQEAVEIRASLAGKNDKLTLASMADLAMIFDNEGRYKEAEVLSNQVLEARKIHLGEHHLDTLASMSSLALAYRKQGRYKEAEALEAQVLKAYKKSRGKHHLDTLSSMGNLAAIFQDQGRYKEAEELEVQVLEARKKHLGEHHPDTLASIGSLASTFRGQARYKEAEELNAQVLEVRKIYLGEYHPDTLASMGSLASIFWDQGQYKEAEALHVQVLEARKIYLGEHHPDTLTSMRNLASTIWEQGRYKEVEELEVYVLEASKASLGEHHPDTLKSMGNLASTLWEQEQYKEAEELEVQCLEASKASLGEHHPDTLMSMGNLALTFGEQGRYEEAEELQYQVLEASKATLGEHHPDTLRSMGNLASTFGEQGRHKEAEELEVHVLEATKATLGEHHPETLKTMSNLSFTLYDLGDADKALDLMTSCFQARQMVLGNDHPDTILSAETIESWGDCQKN